MYLPPAMERAGCFLSYKQPRRFVLRLFLGKKSSESFLASALYRSGAAFVRDAYLKRTRSLCATQPLPGKVADKLEWGWIRNPWLWAPKAIRAMLSCYSGTGERRFHRTGLTELNHLIHRKLPPHPPRPHLQPIFCFAFGFFFPPCGLLGTPQCPNFERVASCYEQTLQLRFQDLLRSVNQYKWLTGPGWTIC